VEATTALLRIWTAGTFFVEEDTCRKRFTGDCGWFAQNHVRQIQPILSATY
jgi:hypothetical protein